MNQVTPSWQLIDSTLREGEQFARGNFTIEQKIDVAKSLDAFGVEHIELTTPVASPASRKTCEAISALGLNAKVLTHIRANLEDAKMAVECGVNGVDIFFATSSELRTFSHGH